MFKKRITFISFVLMIIAAVMGWRLLFINKADQEQAQKLIDNINSKTIEAYSAKQVRNNSRKHFYYNRIEGKPLQIVLDSDRSEIVLDHLLGDASTEVVERLMGVKCYIQEHLFFEGDSPKQVLQYFEADKAFYHYKTNQLVANNVTIFRYETSGHQPDPTLKGLVPLIQGKAELVEWTLPEENDPFSQIKLRDGVHINFYDTYAVQAGTILWDAKSRMLSLKDQVTVSQKDLIKVANENGMQVFLHKEKKGLKQIEGEGKTIFTFKEEDFEHILTCYGHVSVDHDTGKVNLNSPLDAQGNVVEGEQINVQDPMGLIYTDNMTMEYEVKDQIVIPKKFLLNGHVLIRNQFSADSSQTNSLLQYAIADVAEYEPSTKELTLSSKDNPRVLFLDKIHNVQVSAPAIKVKRDLNTNKDSIQGIGDVRFTFVESETKQIRDKFQLSE